MDSQVKHGWYNVFVSFDRLKHSGLLYRNFGSNVFYIEICSDRIYRLRFETQDTCQYGLDTNMVLKKESISMTTMNKCFQMVLTLMTGMLLVLGSMHSTGCKKQRGVSYQPISFEYNEDLLGDVVELPEIGISFRTISSWDRLSEDQFNQIGESIRMNTPLHLISAYKPSEHDYICLITRFPNMQSEADTLLSFQYFESQIAQSDTLFSKGKFAHNGIHFDQIITRNGELTSIHMIGNPLGTKNRFGISFMVINIDYADNVKRMEASIASIKPLRR